MLKINYWFLEGGEGEGVRARILSQFYFSLFIFAESCFRWKCFSLLYISLNRHHISYGTKFCFGIPSHGTNIFLYKFCVDQELGNRIDIGIDVFLVHSNDIVINECRTDLAPDQLDNIFSL
jgi:hypothetical protein